jgi:hypothetical protein
MCSAPSTIAALKSMVSAWEEEWERYRDGVDGGPHGAAFKKPLPYLHDRAATSTTVAPEAAAARATVSPQRSTLSSPSRVTFSVDASASASAASVSASVSVSPPPPTLASSALAKPRCVSCCRGCYLCVQHLCLSSVQRPQHTSSLPRHRHNPPGRHGPPAFALLTLLPCACPCLLLVQPTGPQHAAAAGAVTATRQRCHGL